MKSFPLLWTAFLFFRAISTFISQTIFLVNNSTFTSKKDTFLGALLFIQGAPLFNTLNHEQ